MKQKKKILAALTASLLITFSAPLVSVDCSSASPFKFPYDAADPSAWDYKVLDSIEGVYDKPCIELTKYNDDKYKISVPSEIDGLPVVSIGENVFSSHPEIQYSTLYLPDSIKHCDPYFVSPSITLAIYTETGDRYECISGSEPDQKILAINKCGDRKNIVIPEQVAGMPVLSISGYLIDSDYTAESLELPDTITELDEFFLGGCSTLKKLKFPAHLSVIPSYTLRDFISLEEVIFPEDILFIPIDAFPENILFDYPKDKVVENISEVYSSNSELIVCDSETYWCYSIYILDGQVSVLLFYAPDLEGPPPEEFMGYPVNMMLQDYPPNGAPTVTILPEMTDLNSFDYFDPEKVRNIKIQSEHLTINSQAFQNSLVKTLDFPGDIKLCGSCFQNCNQLKRVSFNGKNPIIDIDFGAFWYDEKLSELIFPESVKILRIENDAFYNSGLEELYLPEGDVTIGESAFSNSMALKKVSVTDNTTINKKAFENCNSLTDVTFRGKVTLSNNTFMYCPSLKNINYDISEPINGGAFTNCTELTSINGKPVLDSNGNIDKDVLSFIEKNFYNADDNGIVNSYIKYIVKKIVSETITDDMNDLQKVKALHDKLCDMVVFDDSKPLIQENHVDVSVFLNDTSVCDGYARAMNLLLHEAGIESCYVSNPSHAWVIANVGGHYFHVDPTWDDIGVTIYDWFMRSDDQIAINSDHSSWTISVPSSLHSFQKNELPVCSDHMGDVNGDGTVDARDATDILTGYAKLSVDSDSDLDPILADYDFNGHIDAVDASKVLTDYVRTSADS